MVEEEEEDKEKGKGEQERGEKVNLGETWPLPPVHPPQPRYPSAVNNS